MVTEQAITDGLSALGIKRGDELEVHASLGSFGTVAGGAETVISALKRCCGEEGSIFMPALHLSPELPLTEADKSLGIVSKIRILPPDRDRSAMGIVC